MSAEIMPSTAHGPEAEQRPEAVEATAMGPVSEDARFVNHPSPEGEALGEMLARFADVEFERDPSLRPRCADCAFTRGGSPNNIAGTLMNALKCVIEKEPFYCHAERGVSNGRLCAGWEALIEAKGPKGRAPWEFIEPAEDGTGRDPSPTSGADDATRSEGTPTK